VPAGPKWEIPQLVETEQGLTAPL
ncbi:hypothetical protein CCACVL1_03087, partial [Corchorus capsularis]